MFGTGRTYLKKFKFIVEIDGITWAGFQKAGPLEAELAVVEQWEGGSLTPQKSPGRVKVANLVLERGATTDIEIYTWFSSVVDIAANTGVVESQLPRTVSIVQQERDGTVVQRYNVFGAWPTKFRAGDWDNTADENLMESVELAYDYFTIERAA